MKELLREIKDKEVEKESGMHKSPDFAGQICKKHVFLLQISSQAISKLVEATTSSSSQLVLRLIYVMLIYAHVMVNIESESMTDTKRTLCD